MADKRPVSETSIDGYGGQYTPWAEAEQKLVENPAGPGKPFWLATTDPDGAPHVVPVGALWVDGRFYFTSGAGTRKSRNLAQNPRCVISGDVPGLDMVVEGEATKVTDDATLERIAAVYASHGWAPTVQDGAFTHEYSAPSAGPPPWYLYEVRPTRAFGLGTDEPYGATRWRF